MKRIAITICAAVAFVACNDKTETKLASSTTTEATTTEPEIDSATAMKNWEAYMTPGEAHKMMADQEGEWTGDITMWMTPGAPPVKNTGTAVNKMILGGRYQQSTHTGNWDGMPFEGQSTVAYDNLTKKYISTWIDNMGTGLMVMEGTYDASTKTINMKGKMVDPMSGKEVNVRETLKMIDNDNQLMEMFCEKNGKEFKNMEIRSTRKKK
jgi:hypothetical protein